LISHVPHLSSFSTFAFRKMRLDTVNAAGQRQQAQNKSASLHGLNCHGVS